MRSKHPFKKFFNSFLYYFAIFLVILNGGLILPLPSASAKVVLPDSRDNEFGENNIVFYNPTGKKCDPKSKKGPVDSSDVFMVGDSITEGSMTELKEKLPNATIVAQTSKQFGGTNASNPTGIEVLKSQSNLPKIIVFALGTNNTNVSQADVDEVISLVGEDRKLIFTTNYKLNSPDAYNANNAKFRAAAQNHDNIGIADWEKAVEGDASKYISSADGLNVHPTAEGKKLFAKTIADAVSLFGGSSSSDPPSGTEGGDNVSKALGYLMKVGYSKEAAAAIIGNLINESGVNPKRFEDGVGNSGATAGDDFRAINPDGTKNFKGGFGIVQWTTLGRVQNLQNYADEHDLPVVSLEAQLGFMVEELKGYNFAPTRLNAMSLEEATFYIFDQYETPGVSFWTTYNGTYYNDYDPTTLTGGSKPLDKNKTPAAYKEFMERLNAAEGVLGITPSSDFGPGGGGGSVDCPEDENGERKPYDGEFPQYFQSDPRWGSLNYGPDGIHGSNGTSISSSGCGPTSFAMMVTALKRQEILPDEVADVAGKAGMHYYSDGGWRGSSWAITKTLADHYGLQYKDFSTSCSSAISVINSALDDGWMIHTSGTGSAPFTSGGHYIGIYGRSSTGDWLIADSSSRGNAAYAPSTVISAGINCSNLKGIK